MDMASPQLQTHLHLNAGQLATYVEVRKMVVYRMRNTSTVHGLVPLDVNWHDKGGKRQGQEGQTVQGQCEAELGEEV